MDFPEPVFIKFNTSFNNAPFDRKCPRCEGKISAKSVHQFVDQQGCVECILHVHKFYKDTGSCIYPDCKTTVSIDYIKKLDFAGEIMMLATKEDIERVPVYIDEMKKWCEKQNE